MTTSPFGSSDCRFITSGRKKTNKMSILGVVNLLNCRSRSKPKLIEAQNREVIVEGHTNYDHTPELCALLADFPSPDPQDNVLHVVFRKSYSEKFIVNLLKSGKFSSQLSIVNSTLALPLHIAMQNEGMFGDGVFDALLDAQPSGSLRVGDIDGSLPIHLACAAEVPSVHAIRRLVKECPTSLRKQSNIRYRYQSSTEQYEEENMVSNRKEPENEGFSAPRIWYSLFTKIRSPIHSVKDPEFVTCRDIMEDEAYESGFTPLHMAVLNHAPAEAIDCLILGDKSTLEFTTSKGRTPMDCAKSLIVDEVSSDDSSQNLKNSFAAIEILEANHETSIRLDRLKKNVADTSLALTSIMKSAPFSPTEPFDAAAKWKQLKLPVNFTNQLLCKNSTLGPKVEEGTRPVVSPEGFQLPPSLKNETIDIELPIDFFRIRHALCKSKSPFLEKEYYLNKMKETEVKIEAWDKFDDHIGSHNLPKHIHDKDFIGATRRTQRLMSKSMLVKANIAYETCSIIKYDDYCFGFNRVTRNPEVPFGSKFEAHTQLIFVNGDGYKTRMVGSMEPVFPGAKPMVAWKIKTAMLTGCSDADMALGEAICEHSGNS